MLCPQCKIDRKEEDFFKKPICFRCQYANKLIVVKKCKVCGKLLPTYKWKTCGGKCAEENAKRLKEEYLKRNRD